MAKKELSAKEQQKRTLTVYRLLTLLFFLLCIAAPVGVLIFSFGTISSVTVLANNETILNGESKNHPDPCSDVAAFADHRPLRFAFGNESDAFTCTWPVLNTVLRLVLSFAGIALVVVSFIFTFPRRGPLLYLFGILIALAGVGFGYVGYDDSSSIYKSNKWCTSGLESVPWTKKPTAELDCRYSPFIFAAVMDFVSALVCILLAVFAVCFVCRAGPVVPGRKKRDSLLSDEQREEEDAPNDPFEKLADKGKDPRDQFGEPEEEPKPKSRGGFFGRFGGGSKKKVSEPDPDSGHVNFEQESASRFAPMSKTDKEASEKPLGTVGGPSPAGQNVGNALFNFDDVQSTDSKPQPEPQAAPKQAQPQAQPQQQQAQPAPQPKPQQGGTIDFEALSGADTDPFA